MKAIFNCLEKKCARKTALALSLFLFVNAANAVLVESVIIEKRGQTPPDIEAAKSLVQTEDGEEFDDRSALRSRIAKDVEILRESGYYSFVNSAIEESESGYNLIFELKVRPRLREIDIQGNNNVKTDKIISLLELERGDRVDNILLAGKSSKVKKYYRKHYFPYAEIDWEIIEIENSVAVDLAINIDEGEEIQIDRIVFSGLESFPADDLKDLMHQKETWFFSWITDAGRYIPGAHGADRMLIGDFYRNHGYLDVAVSEPILERTEEGETSLVYSIEEGPQYKLDKISFSGDHAISFEELRSSVELKTGGIASRLAIDQAVAKIEEIYESKGYFNTRCIPSLESGSEGTLLDLSFKIDKGKQALINTVEIKGNNRTKDKVIRRELVVFPGDMMERKPIETSKKRLQNLGFFEKVESSWTPVDEDAESYDVEFDVEEKPTGKFMVGGGFSSVDSVMGYVELSQGNFDLGHWPPVGGGQKARLRAQIGSERTDIELSFVEPYFMDRKLSLGVDLYKRDASYFSDDYEQEVNGGRLSITKPITAFDRLSLSYSLDDISITDVNSNASPELVSEKGSYLRSALKTTLSHDTRDSYYIPHRGNKSSASAFLSGGFLGGDEDAYGLELKSSQFWPLGEGGVLNLAGALEVVDAYSGEKVPIGDRLFLGGSRTLRGFEYREVGPRDSKNEPIGGRTKLYATLEYTHTIWKNVRAATFYDTGLVDAKAYEFDLSKLNSDFGFGLRFDLPGFPLVINYAWPIEADEYNDDGGQFSFEIGYSF